LPYFRTFIHGFGPAIRCMLPNGVGRTSLIDHFTIIERL